MGISTFIDLCSGIGGGRLGLQQIGLKCVGYCDTSKLSVKTYELMHNVTNEQYFYNLKKIKCDKLPSYDMLIAGFPCQSFSVIGRKDGFSDNCGQIIFHITGYEALLLQGFPKKYADKVKDKISDRHLLMQVGNAMTVNVINSIGTSILDLLNN